mgnify:CR=1 FL=1
MLLLGERNVVPYDGNIFKKEGGQAGFASTNWYAYYVMGEGEGGAGTWRGGRVRRESRRRERGTRMPHTYKREEGKGRRKTKPALSPLSRLSVNRTTGQKTTSVLLGANLGCSDDDPATTTPTVLVIASD